MLGLPLVLDALGDEAVVVGREEGEASTSGTRSGRRTVAKRQIRRLVIRGCAVIFPI